jgi:hypothetical protein
MAALESLRAAGVLVHTPVAGDAAAAAQPADAQAQAAASAGGAT